MYIYINIIISNLFKKVLINISKMLDTNKLNEIGMNTDTINMMKEMNMNNDDIFNELKIILTLYPENLITCLINDINEPLFQSILLRLRLQEKLKLDNNKLRDSFNEILHPLINYLLCEENLVKADIVSETDIVSEAEADIYYNSIINN